MACGAPVTHENVRGRIGIVVMCARSRSPTRRSGCVIFRTDGENFQARHRRSCYLGASPDRKAAGGQADRRRFDSVVIRFHASAYLERCLEALRAARPGL